MTVEFQAILEPSPGPGWRDLYRRFWPAYRRWCYGDRGRELPPRVVAEQRLRQAMPELMPTYRRLLDLAGGEADFARFLTLYRPAPYVAGCSQAVWTRGEPALVRNYDYSSRLWEGVLLCSRWNGKRVMALSDCLWGVLDGVNDAGLVVSLAFGGRRVIGDGFGSPLILRYVLEFCETAEDAGRVLGRVPTHMAYNVTVLDARGDYLTAELAPDRPPRILRRPLATNHQGQPSGERWAGADSSVDREHRIAGLLSDPETTLEALIEDFLRPPLLNRRHDLGFGTLYTAVYYPTRRRMELRWPGRRIDLNLDRFRETRLNLELTAPH